MHQPYQFTRDEEIFVQQFQNCSLPAEQFDHLGHIRLTFLMLQRYPQEIATEKVLTGIKAYAASLGAKDKFHKTLSWFMVQLIASRMTTQAGTNWADFTTNNPDIIYDNKALVLQYYQADRLHSDKARNSILYPDLKERGAECIV